MQPKPASVGEWMALGGGLLLVVGAFLPWASFGAFTYSGTDTDGLFTLGLGLVVLAIVVVREWTTIESLATTAAGGLSLLLAYNLYSNLSEYFGSGYGMIEISAGTGLYLTLVGSAVVVAGGIYGYRNRNSNARDAARAERA